MGTIDRKDLFFGQPNQRGKFHIFDNDKRSLCGRWSMPFYTFEQEDIAKGNEKFNDKNDCWRCFNTMIKSIDSRGKD